MAIRSPLLHPVHPSEAEQIVDGLEARITWPSLEDRAACIRSIAEQVLVGDPFITSCHLLLVGALLGDDEIHGPVTAERFRDLIAVIGERDAINAQQGGDATEADRKVATAVATILGDEAFEECVACDKRVVCELGDKCDGYWFCDQQCHSEFHNTLGLNCPEGQL